jgi:hypothetical protein
MFGPWRKDDDVPFPERFAALRAKLREQFTEAEALTATIQKKLAEISVDGLGAQWHSAAPCVCSRPRVVRALASVRAIVRVYSSRRDIPAPAGLPPLSNYRLMERYLNRFMSRRGARKQVDHIPHFVCEFAERRGDQHLAPS